MVQLPLPWPSYLTACSEKATTVLEKRGVQEAHKTLDLAGSLRDKCNIWQYSFFFFFLSVRFCLLTTLAPIRTTQEGCSSCCRHLQQGPTGATSERWLFVWFWFLQLLCMAWMLARSCWSMPACLHSTGHVEQALPQEPVAASLQRTRRSLPEEQISCRQFQITVNLLAVYQKTNT